MKPLLRQKCVPACKKGELHLKTGKFGSFLGCSNYPECNFTRQLTGGQSEANADGTTGEAEEFPRTLGTDPISGLSITIRKGPYGVYVQLGDEKKPKRSSLPKGLAASTVDLEKALSLLALPREIGLHPETGETIVTNIGRFGPYILHAGKYTNSASRRRHPDDRYEPCGDPDGGSGRKKEKWGWPQQSA